MGHRHAHAASDAPEVEVGRGARLVLLGGLALAGLATVVGLFTFWPDPDKAPEKVPFTGPGVSSVSARVVDVGDPCPVIRVDPAQPPTDTPEFPEGCNGLTATISEGEAKGETVTITATPAVARSGLTSEDTVTLLRIPGEGEVPVNYAFVGIERQAPLGILTVVFVVVVALVARLRGILALLGLGFAGLVVAKFLLPALLAGEPGLGVALTGSAAIMFVVLYLAHGLSIRTSTALAGTLLGVAITAGIGLWGIGAARLSGVGDEGEFLLSYAEGLEFQGLVASAVVIAGLGVLNDVTITQSSAVWELRAVAPSMPRSQIFASAMRIGRDHIASTIYTIVFAYAGTALAVLLLLSLYDRTLMDSLTDDTIAEEVVRTLASAIGLVLAVPVTTAIAAATVSGPARAGDPDDEGQSRTR